MFTNERMAYALDAGGATVNLPYKRFHGIGVNWETFDVAAEITGPPGTPARPGQPAAATTRCVALRFTAPVRREQLHDALSYVVERVGPTATEQGSVVFDKVRARLSSTRR
jgi:hypothetical protein